MTIPIQSQVYNPISGVFGTGQVQFFSSSGTWYVPTGIGKVRARIWGAGGGYSSNSSYYGGGGGGGFAIKTIYDLSGITSIAVTVGSGGTNSGTAGGATGGTSSFGSYASATGGIGGLSSGTYSNTGGTGVGGDINFTGGNLGYGGGNSSGGGGGSASLLGNGGNGGNNSAPGGNSSGGAGGGSGYSSPSVGNYGGNGFTAISGTFYNSSYPLTQSFSTNSVSSSIDFIGTGFGGFYGLTSGFNGGGAGYGLGTGGFPGGGNGYLGTQGGNGLVIVEW